jgi:uncharacterized metal-binding protein
MSDTDSNTMGQLTADLAVALRSSEEALRRAEARLGAAQGVIRKALRAHPFDALDSSGHGCWSYVFTADDGQPATAVLTFSDAERACIEEATGHE